MHEYEVAKILFKIGAVKLKVHDPYKYATGIMSPVFIDCRVLNSYPKERKTVLGYFLNYIDQFIGRNNISLVVGSGHSGISLTAYLVENMRVPMAYIRKSAKAHGKGNQVEGIIRKGDRAIIITDIIDDENHIATSVNLLREMGVEIVHVLSIVNMKLGIADKFLKDKKIRYFTLTDLRILISTATSENIISLIEGEEIENWRKNFKDWGKNRETDLEKNRKNMAEEGAEILLKNKAVTLSPSVPYKYASGIFSPIYCDNRLLISYPNDWLSIINSMLKIIVNEVGIRNIDVIGGTSTAGIPHAAYISDKLNLPMVYIKSSAAEYGRKRKIEGDLKKGSRVLVIEDLISTGGSSIKAIESVRELGGVVNSCIAIFTYEMEKADEEFRKAECSLYTVSNFSTLMDVAVKHKYISIEEQNKAMEWNQGPDEWGRT
ncbi:MAG: orotate phosphoribosyltransferase [Spirochaetaceae bacterium]|nr:orotate phosphoribosyltransferase [Spirochaetaceae bacterium]